MLTTVNAEINELRPLLIGTVNAEINELRPLLIGTLLIGSRNCFEYAIRIRGSSKIERVDFVLHVLITSNTNLQLNFVDPFSEFNRLSIIKPRGKSDTSYVDVSD